MNQQKPRVIKDFEKLSTELQEQIKLVYPYGFSEDLISFTDRKGKLVSALPFETDEKYYLVRMTVSEALQIIEDDDDYDNDGMLKEVARNEFEGKYSEIDYIAENMGNDNGDDDDDYDD
ncbi:MAG: hypothetical protein GXO81_10920 [Chlorobi bacterium]|nr:hypothetical protein [Chlorobiota bacterium]